MLLFCKILIHINVKDNNYTQQYVQSDVMVILQSKFENIMHLNKTQQFNFL